MKLVHPKQSTPRQSSPKLQRGITLGGVFIFMMLMGFAAYIAARVLPGYMDYWTVQRIMKNVLEMPNIQDAKESAIRTKFNRELQTNNMKTVTSDDLIVEWVPNGVRLSVSFSMKQPFMGPVSLCLDFQAEATSN
jgi:Tfp pilus assembly protein PilX